MTVLAPPRPPPLAALLLLVALVLLASCQGDGTRHRELHGPARLHIDGTVFTPGLQVEIDEGGWVYFGPVPREKSFVGPDVSDTRLGDDGGDAVVLAPDGSPVRPPRREETGRP